MTESMQVTFRLNTHGAIEPRGEEFWISGERAALRVVPLNWTPARFLAGTEGIDSHLKPVNLLRLFAPQAVTHRLLTAIEVIPAGEPRPAWRFTHGELITATRLGMQVQLSVARRPALQVTVTDAGKQLLAARCQNDQWELDA
jgi:hypothetical protein